MALPIELEPRAEQEMRAALLWYRERSERAAEGFQRDVDIAIERIGAEPNAYAVVEGELRRYALDRFPYSVLYSVTPTAVRVIAVAHQHRKPGYWRNR